MTPLIYDAIIVAILAFFFLRGRKKGLILTLCSLAAIFIALFGARAAVNAFTPKAIDLLTPRFSSAIEEQLGNGLEEKLDEMLAAGAESDNIIATVLNKLGFYDELAAAIENAVMAETSETMTNVAVALARAVAEVVASVLIFVLAFLIILVLWFLLSRALDLAARLPVLKSLNRMLGGLFGLLQGILVLFLVGWVLRLMGGVIPEDVVAQTTLLNFFCTTNFISLLTGI